MPRIIALLNPRSATGKTTLGVNLAFSLSLLEKRVLYVDCTSTGMGTKMLLSERERPGFGVSDVMSGLVGARGAIVQGRHGWLDLLPFSAGEKETEELLAHNPDKERVLYLSLRPLMDIYDAVFIDTPSGDGFFVKSALVAAEEVLIPLHPGWDGNSQLKEARSCADEVMKQQNPQLAWRGIVSMGPTERVVETDLPLVGSLPHCEVVQKGMAQGIPAALLDVFSEGAQAFLSLADTLVTAKESAHVRGTA